MSNSSFNPMLDDDDDDFSSNRPQSQERMLPKAFPLRQAPPSSTTASNGLEDFFSDDEPDLSQTLKAEGKNKQYGVSDDPVTAMIEERFKLLKKQYPGGGWKSLQLIDLKILLAMTPDWLKRFEEDVEEGTKWTQRQLAARERSDAIAEAQAHPTDDSYQDAAFRAVQSILTEFLDRKAYRGTDRFIMMNLVASEIIGLSAIDPIWRDRSVDEIIINGPYDVQVEIRGRLLRVPAARFRNEAHVLQMLERIFSSINKTLSKNTPYLDGRLHDQSRIAAVHTAAAPEGPNVAIRRHPDRYWTAKDLVNYGSFDPEVGTWLGNMIYKGCSFVVIGGTSTGKTSFLNAMTGFYPDDVRLITIEDNLEMKPHPGKMLAAAMEAIPPSVEGAGGISIRELVKATLRMRPDGLIIGEVRDGAAYDLAQALNTGHFGTSTIHANSEFDGIYRIASLIQQGAELTQEQALPLIAAAFDFVVLLEHFPEDGSRRLVSISEVDPYVTRDAGKAAELKVRQLFKFVADGKKPNDEGELKIYGHWEKTGELSEIRRERRHLDLIPDKSWEELLEISEIPAWALKKEKE